MLRLRATLALVAAVAVVSGACGGGGESTHSATTDDVHEVGDESGAFPEVAELRQLSVATGGRQRIIDDQGREILLRGVNVNSLGEYHQDDPALEPTVPLTTEDWDQMAALGFDVVRLIVSWSRLEPERGTIDEGYLGEIDAALDEAESHGIYVVLDMHQDAWSATLSTPDEHECPEGLEPAIGWDGAPAWATLTDGAETCRNPGSRESAAAVRAAFQAFYDDREGIRAALVETWGRLAGEFANRPVVAGYDLLNEPNGVEDLAILQPKYTAFLTEVIAAIRAAERARPDGFAHVMFVEPIVLWPMPDSTPPTGFTDDPDIVFAPHNYWEAIVSGLLTIEEGFSLDRRAAEELGVPFWVGEYGWWDTSQETLSRLRRYAAAEDAAMVGGAWWQWRQACGDPHSIGTPGGEPDDVFHLHTLRCPEGIDEGVTEDYAVVLSRPYPRAAPGALTELRSDPDQRTLTISGRAEGADPGARLIVWAPDGGHGEPVVGGMGLGDLRIEDVPGGWLISAAVGCEYRLEIDGVDGIEGSPTPC